MRAILNVLGVALVSGALVTVATTRPAARRTVIPAMEASGSPSCNLSACSPPGATVNGATAQRVEGRARLLVFSSKSCPACMHMEPVLGAALMACGGEKDALRIDFDGDAGEALAATYGVILLPSFVSVDGRGFEVARLTGVQPEASLERAVAEVRGARGASAPARGPPERFDSGARVRAHDHRREVCHELRCSVRDHPPHRRYQHCLGA